MKELLNRLLYFIADCLDEAGSLSDEELHDLDGDEYDFFSYCPGPPHHRRRHPKQMDHLLHHLGGRRR